jgi:hypothetical protein
VVAYGANSVEVTPTLISVDLFVRDMSLVLAPLPDFILHNVIEAVGMGRIHLREECTAEHAWVSSDCKWVYSSMGFGHAVFILLAAAYMHTWTSVW